ncbi:MAG: LamG-like jellyroll fold domain-containing protein [Limisphaerales bacterium]
MSNLAAGAKIISVVVTNIYGAATSSVSFTVVDSCPIILQQPQSISRFTGFPFSFSVTADGSQPLTYFWKFSNTVVQAGSSPIYSGTASPDNAGTYACIVSNSLGTIVSSNATLALSPVLESYSGQVLASSPISYWRLGESSGNLAFDSIAGNNGTYFNVALNQSGYSPADTNKAIAVAGTNSYVGNISGTAINFTGYTNNFTLEVWVKGSTNQTDNATIIAKGNGNNGIGRTEQFSLDVVGGVYRFFTSGEGTIYPVEAGVGPNGNWQHIVAVYDQMNTLGNGSKAYIFVNGELQGMGDTRPYGLNSTTTPISFGSKRSGFSPDYDDTFNGTIDEVSIYDKALDPSTIQAHYLSAYGSTTAPFITAQPQSLTNYAGLRATLQVTAAGSQPLSYQWLKNGGEIGRRK